jgi:hypothetical protein
MLPSQLVDLSSYPRVSSFVTGHLDMQFDDVRSMMKLPRPKQGLTGGCNFAAAATLCSLLAGVARILYQKPPRLPGTGNGFVALLMQYYPWETRENGKRNAEILYDLVRNPLAHSLGLATTPVQRAAHVTVVKTSHSERQLRRIERSVAPPGPSLAVATHGNEHTIWMTGLYWGCLATVRGLCGEPSQMEAAERRLRERGWFRDA